ncbi:MAG: SpoIID/LytB domain-containing protein [Evtepia gabavorous]
MKKIIGVALILVVVLFALPFVVRQAQDTGQDPQPTAQEEAALPDSGHTLRVKGSDGQVTEMDLNQYLWGVVAAEMPASFSQEALKARAVAARTYALNKGPSFNHPDADLCTDYACCQAGLPGQGPGQLGDKAAEYTNKITTAVAETGNQVILTRAAHRRGLSLLLQRGHPGRGGGLGQQRALSQSVDSPRGRRAQL